MNRDRFRTPFIRRGAAILLCTALLWAVLFPIASSSNIRMDSDRMLYQSETAMNQYIRENRGGLVILLRLFGLDRWDPVRSGVLYLLFLSLSGWLLCFFIRRLTCWKCQGWYLLIFLLYTFSPVWAFHAYFVLQLAPVGAGMLLCTGIGGIDFLFYSSERKRPGLRAVWEVSAALLLCFSLLIYQALIVHYFAVWAALMFCFLRKNKKAPLSAFVLPAFRVILAIAVYLPVSRLLRGGAATEYLNNQILWGRLSLLQCCFQILRAAGATLLLIHSGRFSLYPVAVVCLFLLNLRLRKEKDAPDRLQFALVSAALLLAPFAFNILLGNATVPRTQYALQLTAAFVPVFFLAETAGRHKVLKTILVLALVIQAALTVRLNHTDNVRYRLDTQAAQRICEELDDADPALPVVFRGKLAMDGSPVLTEKTDVYGLSFFEWVYEDSRPSSATASALRFIAAYSGKKYTALPDGPVKDRAMEEAELLPCYPEDGFVQETEKYILVNLSAPSGNPAKGTD